MKLGLITDVHEELQHLQAALDLFRKNGVDDIIFIGDVCDRGKRLEESCRLLNDAKVKGVWGNHDFGLCFDIDDEMRAKYAPVVIEFMTSLRPRLDIEDCYFAHIEPWLNPEELADLWYFDGTPDEHGQLDRIFKAVPHRLMFAGHYHKWLLVSPEGVKPWDGDSPVRLDQGRYFVVIGALCDGQCAIFDTETSELQPFCHPFV